MEGEDGVEGGLGPGQAPSGVCGFVCCKDQFGCHVAQKDLQSQIVPGNMNTDGDLLNDYSGP